MLSSKDKQRPGDLIADADANFRRQFQRRAPGRFDLREAAASDRRFMNELLADAHREAQRRLCGEVVVELGGPLLELQLDAQRLAYQANHPRAIDYIVLRSETQTPIGRMLIDWASESGASVAVDLAVLSSERTGAAGWSLLRAWVDTCDRLDLPAALHVMPDNPARRLYQRLGFLEANPLAFPIPMHRAPRVALARRATASGSTDPAASPR